MEMCLCVALTYCLRNSRKNLYMFSMDEGVCFLSSRIFHFQLVESKDTELRAVEG